MLGYFSIIGLLRLHCQLGDYHLALKMMENIELNKKVCPFLFLITFFFFLFLSFPLFLPKTKQSKTAKTISTTTKKKKKKKKGTFHTCYCLPYYNVLLCWILLCHDKKISGRLKNLLTNSIFHFQDKSLSSQESSE